MSAPPPSWLARCALGAVAFYKKFLSKPLHLIPGSGCRFYPTCSAYALHALEGNGLIKGSYLSVHRFCRCQPFCQGGHDPVPEPQLDAIKPLFSFTEPPKKNHP